MIQDDLKQAPSKTTDIEGTCLFGRVAAESHARRLCRSHQSRRLALVLRYLLCLRGLALQSAQPLELQCLRAWLDINA